MVNLQSVNSSFLKKLYDLIGWEEEVVKGEVFKGVEGNYKVKKLVYNWNIGIVNAGTTYSVAGNTDVFPDDLIGDEATLFFIKSIEVKGAAVVSISKDTFALGGLSRDNLFRITPCDEGVVLELVNYKSSAMKVVISNPSNVNSNIVLKFNVLRIVSTKKQDG